MIESSYRVVRAPDEEQDASFELWVVVNDEKPDYGFIGDRSECEEEARLQQEGDESEQYGDTGLF